MTKKKKGAGKRPGKKTAAAVQAAAPKKQPEPRKAEPIQPAQASASTKAKAPVGSTLSRDAKASRAGATDEATAASNPSSSKVSEGKRQDMPGNGTSPRIGAIPDSVAEAARPLQTFAVEMQRMAQQSVNQTAEVLERLRDAKSVEEVVSLQTTFMQQSFRRYTEFAGRISQLMTASQMSLFQQGQAAMRSFRSIATGG